MDMCPSLPLTVAAVVVIDIATVVVMVLDIVAGVVLPLLPYC